MKEEIEKLSFFPKRYALIKEEPWKSKGIRKIVVRNFFVYYWIDDRNHIVQVAAIIYSKRNQAEQLINIDMI